MATKTVFRTAYSEQIRKEAPTGGPMQNEYGYEVDNFGRKVLVKTGETNLYARIQESLEETKIENIIARVTTGDTSMLRPDGIYADLSEIPNNLIEARQQMQKLENVWGDLPREIKEKYNFNVEEFIGAAGSDGWLRDMGLLEKKEEAPTPTPEIKAKEETKDE